MVKIYSSPRGMNEGNRNEFFFIFHLQSFDYTLYILRRLYIYIHTHTRTSIIYIYTYVCVYVYQCLLDTCVYRTKTVIFFYNIRLNSMHDYEINGCGVARGGGKGDWLKNDGGRAKSDPREVKERWKMTGGGAIIENEIIGSTRRKR